MAGASSPRLQSKATGQATRERFGILSRTLNSSSTVRWILPARIRCPSKNDIVFVGPTFIQLHEFLDSGQLVDVTAKLDFGTPITDVKVISADVKIIPVVDAILRQEKDQEQFNIRGKPVAETEPPQILVLLTHENELIYVYAQEDAVGDVSLVFAKRPFLRGAGLPDSQCRYIAVDPQSRALAVASPTGYVGIFNLRSVDEIKSQIERWDPLNQASFRPSEEQRFIQVDGRITMMTFLRSPESDPTKVLLLILVHPDATSEELYQYLYKWDIDSPLHALRPMACSGRQLKEDQLPMMLIPSTRAYSYLLVMPSGITYYENVHSSESKRVNCRFMEKLTESLQWVQWAKPRRHTQYLEKRDDLVILREDGLLQYFQIEKASSTKFNMNNTIGRLGFNVDSAFCMLAGPPGKGGDIIIAGGSMTDGGVFHVSARGSPERIQTIETICPLRDIVVGPPQAVDANEPAQLQGIPGRLYAGCGPYDGQGQLSEIRYGLEAQIGWTMPFPDAGWVRQLFTLEIPHTNELLLLATHATQSSMVAFDLETQDISFTDVESHPGFVFDSPTLAAAVLDQSTVVQVTEAGISVICIEDSGRLSEATRIESRLVHANLFEDDRILATTSQTESSHELALIRITTSPEGTIRLPRGPPAELSQTPTCLTCLQIDATRLVVIGTSAGTLLGYIVTSKLSLKFAFEYRVNDLHPRLKASVITSLCALTQASSGPTLLLCGLRSGSLLCLELKTDENNTRLTVRCEDFYRIGATDIQLRLESGHSSNSESPCALVLCEFAMHRVTLHPNAAVIDYTVSPLWVTDRTNPSAQPIINSVHRIPKLGLPYDQPGGLLVLATEADLLFCSLVAQEHGIVKHLHMNGVPRRMLYSRFLDKLVVAYSRDIPVQGQTTQVQVTSEKDSPNPSSQIVKHVGVQLVESSLMYPQGGSFSTVVSTDVHETVHALIDWAPTDGMNHYEWFVLALEQHRDFGTPGCRGRVVCINAKSLGKSKPDTNPKIAFTSGDSPVTAICAYKISSLLIAAGKELLLRHLDWTTRSWKTLSKHSLPSPAKKISCQGSFIFVATTHHSLFVLMEQDNTLSQHKGDTMVRYTMDVLAFDGPTAVFAAADAGFTNVIALSGWKKDDTESALPIFHAVLPLHVNCLTSDTYTGSSMSQQSRFYGATIDGTLFHFSFLKYHEWKLLRFVEEMSYLDRKTIKAVPIKKRDPNNREYALTPSPIRSRDMHVRGDRLLLMVERGPYNLRNILKGSERLEPFKALVQEVLGETDDPTEVVIAWMRRLLRYPARSRG